jgi:excisionase family DNA binding protein
MIKEFVIMAMESPMLTVEEAAKYLKVGVSTVYNLVRSTDFPAIKVMVAWRIIKGELDLWIQRQFVNKNL